MMRSNLLAALSGTLLAGALAGGIAWASIGDGGVIQSCYDSGGNLKVIASLPCPKGYTAVSWNQKGDPGPKGDAGAKGDPGPAGQPGAPGANGVSPTVAQLTAGDPNCPAGGAAITDAPGSTAYVCSGEKGADGTDADPFSGTFTSRTASTRSPSPTGASRSRTGRTRRSAWSATTSPYAASTAPRCRRETT
jgi:hypothetical protein